MSTARAIEIQQQHPHLSLKEAIRWANDEATHKAHHAHLTARPNTSEPSPSVLLSQAGVPITRIPSTELAIRHAGGDVAKVAGAIAAKVLGGMGGDEATTETIAALRREAADKRDEERRAALSIAPMSVEPEIRTVETRVGGIILRTRTRAT